MRISVDPNDPGYDPKWINPKTKVKIFLNDEYIETVVTADDEEGIVVFYEQRNGILQSLKVGLGKVRIELPNTKKVCKKCERYEEHINGACTYCETVNVKTMGSRITIRKESKDYSKESRMNKGGIIHNIIHNPQDPPNFHPKAIQLNSNDPEPQIVDTASSHKHQTPELYTWLKMLCPTCDCWNWFEDKSKLVDKVKCWCCSEFIYFRFSENPCYVKGLSNPEI